ncbi:MAG: ABC transporter permease [Phycisphaerales bacterium]|nr:MAG: ABC transporter permease [Phycisphaerales bacterium]
MPELSGNCEQTFRWALRRALRRHPLAFCSGLVLVVLLILSVSTLPLSVEWYNVQELQAAVRHAPSIEPVIPLSQYTSASETEVTDGIVASAHGVSSWLGHDDLGRSLLYRLLPAFLVSLAVGLAAAMMAVVIGTAVGSVAALFGGRVDMVLMRIVDILYGLPYILMVILLKIALTGPLTALFGGRSKYADVVILFVAIGGVSWLTMARVIRGQVLSLRQQPFVEAARASGAGPWYILRRHLLPNLIGPIAVYATLVVPQAILQESFLSFLGVGIQQPVPSLGRLAADGVEAVNTFVGFWWLLAFPCGLLIVTLLALNFMGDGLRNAFDPKSSAATLV